MILLLMLWDWHKDCKRYGGNNKLAVTLRDRLRAYLLCVAIPVLLGIAMRVGQ